MTLALSFNLAEVNWLAVLVVGVGVFMLGGLWYTALFGKLWAALNGYSEEKLKQMSAKRPPAMFFGTLIVCYLVISLMMALLVTAFNVTGALNGAALGLTIWVLVSAIEITGQMASDKPMSAWLIDGAYQLLYLVGAGVVLALWR